MSDESSDLRSEVEVLESGVSEEIDAETAMLESISAPRRWEGVGHLLAIALIVASAAVLLAQKNVLFVWLISGILLYSYNFIILLIPRTTRSVRPCDEAAVCKLGKEQRWMVLKLLMGRRRLSIEMGLTVFLSGMVPLALSFSIIFGFSLILFVYYGFVVHLLEAEVVLIAVVQIAFILLFYLMIVALRPQAQGITALAVSYRVKIGKARSEGRLPLVIVLMVVVALVILSTTLALGAVLLPGYTLLTVFHALQSTTPVDIVSFAFVFVAQLAIRRHFQSYASTRMVTRLLNDRITRFREEILIHLEEMLLADANLSQSQHGQRISELRRKYYSLAIYDVIEHRILGLSPVYLVGPRLRFVLDTGVLGHLSR